MSGKVNQAYVVTFAVRNGDGTPRTGLVAGDFTATVRNPGDTASDTPSVSEVGGGQYRVTISAAFTNTHGAGEYGITVELTTAPNDIIGGTVEFKVADLDDLAQPGDEMDLVTDAVDANAVATTGANEIRDAILSDATAFAGANIDAAISSRSSHSAADVDTQLSGTHGAGSWATATGFAVPGDAMALTPAAVDAIWDEIASGHLVAGSLGEYISLLRHQGAIHIDTKNGAAGTTVGVNGTPENPVSNLADAVTLAAASGLRRYRITGTIALVSAHDDWVFEGAAGESVVQLGGQDVADSLFIGCELSGAALGPSPLRAVDCLLDGVTMVGVAIRCRLRNTTTLLAGTSTFIACASEVPGTGTPVLDLVGAGRNANVRGYSGGLELRNMTDAGQNVTTEYIAGQIVVAASCSAGTLEIRGVVRVTDNSTGTTVSEEAALARTPIANVVEALQAANHGAGSWLTATGFAVPGDAMDLVTDAVDANSVATSGAQEIRDEILSDSIPFPGANIDAAISSRAAPGAAMDLVANAVDATSIANDAITDAKLAADTDTYQAKVWLIDDDSGTTDRYVVAWFKNGQPIFAGITVPTIRVFDSTGSALFGSTALAAVGAEGVFRHDEGTSRIVDGTAYFARVEATIDTATRTWIQPIGRDSS